MRYFWTLISTFMIAGPAFADIPRDGAWGFQEPATRIMERNWEFHGLLLWIIIPISLFVLGLLIWVVLRYNEKANPVPSKVSHNTLIEIIWTTVPALILVGISGISLPYLYYVDVPPNLEDVQDHAAELEADGKTRQLANFEKNYFPDAAAKGYINIKAQGNQWSWTYTYPDLVDADGYPLEFTAKGVDEGKPSDKNPMGHPLRLLETDYPVVVPVDRYIRYYTAASDVIHAWTVPAFGVKTDAVPGRLNEGWFLVNKTGVYYGQCSELCGKDHAYMPIEVHVVSQIQYDRWAELMIAGQFERAAEGIRQVAANRNKQDTQLASN